MLQQDDLLSAIGVDYIQLRDLLAAGQWQKADEETGAVMLKIARRVTAGWLRELFRYIGYFCLSWVRVTCQNKK